MMKRLVASLLCLALLAGLTACGGKDTVSRPSESNTPSSSDTSSHSDSSPSENTSTSDSSVAGPTSSHGSGQPEDSGLSQPPSDTAETDPLASLYCYSRLNETQQAYYAKMYEGISSFQTSWIVLGEAHDTYKQDIAVVRSAIVSDHPDIFWLPSYYATALATANDGSSSAVVYFSDSDYGDPAYLILRSEAAVMKRELETAIKEITDLVTATDPYGIELQLHDLLCQRVSYSDDSEDPFIYTAYGALVNGRALCEGYSKAMQLLLSRFGINSVTVTGVAGEEAHMWNAVELDGKWYHLDVTWNDTRTGGVSHEYFNLTDKMISADHTLGKNLAELGPDELEDGTASFNIHRPACTATLYNYFNRSGFVYFGDDPEALASYLVRADSDGTEVRFSDDRFRERFISDPDGYISAVNEALIQNHPDCGFTISSYSVSTLVLRLFRASIHTPSFEGDAVL